MNTVQQLADLAAKIHEDKPHLDLSQLAAEVLRATVGVGKYALPVPQRKVEDMVK